MSQSSSDDSSARGDSAPAAGPARIRPGGFRELGPFGWAVNRIGARVTGSSARATISQRWASPCPLSGGAP